MKIHLLNGNKPILKTLKFLDKKFLRSAEVIFWLH